MQSGATSSSIPAYASTFAPRKLADHPRAAWDGTQAIKIKDELDLDQYLTVAVVPQQARSGASLNLDVPRRLRDRVVALDHHVHHGLAAWSSAAFAAADGQRDRRFVRPGMEGVCPQASPGVRGAEPP